MIWIIENILLDPIDILLITSLALHFLFFIFLFLQKREKVSYVYLAHIFSIIIWIVFNILNRSIYEGVLGITIAKLFYAAASLAVLCFHIFVLELVGKLNKKLMFLNIASLLVVAFYSYMMIDGIEPVPFNENRILLNNYYYLFILYISSYFIYSFYLIIKKYLNSKKDYKWKLYPLIFGALFTAIVSSFTNMLFPLTGNFNYAWFGQIASSVLVIGSAVAILTRKLFDIKALTLSVFAFLLMLLIMFNILSSTNIIFIIIGIVFFVLSLYFFHMFVKINDQTIEYSEQLQLLNKKISQQNKKIALQKNSLEELLRMKEETLHIVNHQINTPIYAIRSALAMFQDKFWTQEKFLDVVNVEIKRITETVGQFLAARKVDTGKLIINKTLTDFGTLASTLIEEKKLLRKVRENNISITYKEEGNIPPVNMDMPKITEVVSNLLDNAINYSSKDILVTLKRDKANVVLSVKDSGIGIPKDQIKNLFQRFLRLDNAKKTRPDGTGLGLYVCKQIVEGHKGLIWAESEGEGKGSTFNLSLPIS